MKLTNVRWLLRLFVVFGVLAPQAQAAEQEAPIPIKVVVVTMFERGAATGDGAGEFQYWVERFPLEEEVPFPLTGQPLRINKDRGVLGVVTGIGTIKAAATIMALGIDERFDLSKAYWVIAGIAGIDPADGSVGSAAWAEWVVDGDLAHQIDAREISEEWSTGYIPLRRDSPFEEPAPPTSDNYVYRLNPGLTDWAYEVSKDVPLEDTEGMQKLRAHYEGFPNAQRPPFVLKGDQLSAMTYWHGAQMNEWANKWLPYWTEGQAEFVTSAMEDSGTLHALSNLSKVGKVDFSRVLLLRTASNYSMQYPGVSAAESLNGEGPAAAVAGAGFLPSLEAAYRVGGAVVEELLSSWETAKDQPPTTAR